MFLKTEACDAIPHCIASQAVCFYYYQWSSGSTVSSLRNVALYAETTGNKTPKPCIPSRSRTTGRGVFVCELSVRASCGKAEVSFRDLFGGAPVIWIECEGMCKDLYLGRDISL